MAKKKKTCRAAAAPKKKKTGRSNAVFKRRKARTVMREYGQDQLHSSSGELVTDVKQAKAIAASEQREADRRAAKRRRAKRR